VAVLVRPQLTAPRNDGLGSLLRRQRTAPRNDGLGFRPAARGMTLLEVLVAGAASVVIFGLVLGILVSTSRSSGRVIRREALLQQGQLVMQSVREILENVVWPEDLGTTVPGHWTLRFERYNLYVLAAAPSGDDGYAYCQLYTFMDAAGYAAACCRQAPGEAAPAVPAALHSREFNATLEFQYADTMRERRPLWRDRLSAPEDAAAATTGTTHARPALIWVEAVVKDPTRYDERGEPLQIRLQTAIPVGRLRAGEEAGP